MLRFTHILIIFFLNLFPLAGIAQTEKWVGTWEMHYKPWPHIAAIDMELQVAAPIENMLYPAKLTISDAGFKGEYELLLVKKNNEELGIGRNKYPLKEEPFSLGPWMMYLNGTFRHSTGANGDSLVLRRLWIDNFGIFMKGIYDNELYTNHKSSIRNFLYQEPITLSKKNHVPWTDPHVNRIVHTDTIFYGVYDSVEVHAPHMSLAVQDEERYDRDTVTIVHNGKLLAQGLALKEATKLNEVVLDSGENYIAFFAENYGDVPPNTANFLLSTKSNGGNIYSFNFANSANVFSTLMVGRFIYKPLESSEQEDTAIQVNKEESRTAGRRDIPIGTLEVHDEKLTIELWDEQVEDGDVISLYVNDVKVIKNVSVKKRVKKFDIALEPGINRILFFAENLGLIAPNTAALRVRAGEIEKSLYLHTDLQQNNLLEVVRIEEKTP